MGQLETIDFTFQVCFLFYVKLIIIGYCGYVPSIKSENAFGESYGKTTGASVSGNIK